MIFIALGANLDSPEFGSPRHSCVAALRELHSRGVKVVRVSRWMKTAPVPLSDQPWYSNAVAEVETDLSARDLLGLLHRVEDRFGRVRVERWGARVLDLDLLDYHHQVTPPQSLLQLPHPRLHLRRFVLQPLVDLAPDWRHPVLGQTVQSLLDAIPVESQELVVFESSEDFSPQA